MRKNMYSSARLQRSTRHNFDKQVTFVSFLNKVEKWIDARASKEVAGAEWKRRWRAGCFFTIVKQTFWDYQQYDVTTILDMSNTTHYDFIFKFYEQNLSAA